MPIIRPADHRDAADIRSLLAACGLPVEDLDTAVVDLLVMHAADVLVGVVGVERFGHYGLLRSLAVTSALRGTGIGEKLLHAAELHAHSSGLIGLVLLTTTAAPFFAHRGYVIIGRTDAPAAVQGSAEFRSICPLSATCMSKTLESAE